MEFYLDAAPLIRALSEDPGDFEMGSGYVLHRPSDHGLAFDPNGTARLFARCSCADLPISKAQSDELQTAVAAWEASYWRPRMAREAAKRQVAAINRAFAEHFRPQSRLRRALDALRSFLGLPARWRGYQIDPSLPEDAELADREAAIVRQIQGEELALF